MPTLMERLPRTIMKLEAEFGSDNPFVKSLKQQLANMRKNAGKSLDEVWYAQSMPRQEPTKH
jgi:hypothetical protein